MPGVYVSRNLGNYTFDVDEVLRRTCTTAFRGSSSALSATSRMSARPALAAPAGGDASTSIKQPIAAPSQRHGAGR